MGHPRLPCLANLVALLAICSVHLTGRQASGVAEAISPGAAIEHTTVAGEVRTLELPVSAGAVFKLTVDQHGADVQTTITAPEATPIVLDLPDRGRIGPERLVWRAPASGTARLSIRTVLTDGPAGRYRVQVSPLDQVAGLDAAVRALADAARLPHGEPRAGALRHAEALIAALDVWQRLGDRELLAETLMRLGRVRLRWLQLGNDAADAFTEAASTYEALGLDVDLVDALLSLGGAHRQAGRIQEALATYEQAQRQSTRLGPHMRAIVESDLGRILSEIGDAERGAEHARRAIAAFKDAGALGDAIVTLERLAESCITLRRLDDALQAIVEALALAPRYGKPSTPGSLTRTLGRIHAAAGDDEAAIAAFRTATGLVPAESADRLVLEIDVARQLNRRGDYAVARETLEPVLARVPAQQQNIWAAMASELGVSLAQTGDAPRALALQTKALAVVRAGGSSRNEMVVLRELAATQRVLHDAAGARATTARLAEVARTLPGDPLAAVVLREQARDARLSGDLPLARRYAELAIADIESARARVRSLALRTAFGGNTRGFYDDAIDLAMAMHAIDPGAGHDARALTLFERSRARSLSDLLAGARVDVRAGLDPSLVEQERELARQIAMADAAIRAAAADEAGQARVAGLETAIAAYSHQLAILDAQARASSGRYRAVMRPALASIAEIQALLDADTVLLAYTFGVTHGWGWAVTRSEVHAFPVAPLAPIDAAARRVVDGVRRPARAATAVPAAGLPADIAALSAMVLGPIGERLDGVWRGHRLAIVASGPLEYVPFAALSLPAGGEAGAARTRWLGQEHEVVLLPSASVLAILREPGQARRTPTGGLVVVADPVYSPADPRVRRQTTRRDQGAMRTASPAGPVPVLERSWRRTRGDGSPDEFARLLFSRQEARALAQIAGPLGAVQALDFDASLETFKSRAVAEARLVHVATHGILDAVQPERSGLVLSLVDPQGRPRDGVLRLDDIFGLSLSADLVVLSGCETGLGRQMRGEGLVGLTRAFMYAGAPRIVSSLWQVDDQATAQLMTRFYRHMLQQSERPAAALRAAQMELAREPRWAAPYFWAGFVLHGDWR